MIYRGVSLSEDEAAPQLPGLAEVLANSDENAKRAIAAYLFLAVERKPGERFLRLFDELFMARPGNAGEYSLAQGYGDFADDRDTVIRICDACLDEADDNDERYDLAVEAMREAEEGIARNPIMAPAMKNFKSVYFGAMKTFGSYGFVSVQAALLVYNLVLTGMRENIYEGSRKKLVRFIVRFTKRDKASLAELEEIVREMAALERQAAEVMKNGASDTYEHITARLAGLRAEEPALKGRLEALLRRDLFAEREAGEEEEEPGDDAEKSSYADYSPGEKIVDDIADGICAGIETVTGVLCAPFEWLTDKLNGWS